LNFSSAAIAPLAQAGAQQPLSEGKIMHYKQKSGRSVGLHEISLIRRGYEALFSPPLTISEDQSLEKASRDFSKTHYGFICCITSDNLLEIYGKPHEKQ
jgi:hypothetical protein